MYRCGSCMLIKRIYSFSEVKKEKYIKEEINFSVNWTLKHSPRCGDYYCVQSHLLSHKDLHK